MAEQRHPHGDSAREGLQLQQERDEGVGGEPMQPSRCGRCQHCTSTQDGRLNGVPEIGEHRQWQIYSDARDDVLVVLGSVDRVYLNAQLEDDEGNSMSVLEYWKKHLAMLFKVAGSFWQRCTITGLMYPVIKSAILPSRSSLWVGAMVRSCMEETRER